MYKHLSYILLALPIYTFSSARADTLPLPPQQIVIGDTPVSIMGVFPRVKPTLIRIGSGADSLDISQDMTGTEHPNDNYLIISPRDAPVTNIDVVAGGRSYQFNCSYGFVDPNGYCTSYFMDGSRIKISSSPLNQFTSLWHIEFTTPEGVKFYQPSVPVQTCSEGECEPIEAYFLEKELPEGSAVFYDGGVVSNTSGERIIGSSSYRTICSGGSCQDRLISTSSLTTSAVPGATTTTFTNAAGNATQYVISGPFTFSEILPGTSSPRYKVSPIPGVLQPDSYSWPYNMDGRVPQIYFDEYKPDGSYARTSFTEGTNFPPGVSHDTIVTKQDGSKEEFLWSDFSAGYETNKRIIEYKDGLGRSWSYDYDEYYRIRTIYYPDGETINRIFDNRGNILEERRVAKPGTGLPDIVTTKGFPANCDESNYRVCNKPIWEADAKGNRTDYQYDTRNGFMTGKLGPADVNGFRPLTKWTVAAFGQSVNGHVPAGVAVPAQRWAVTEKRECIVSPVTGTTVDFNSTCPDANAEITRTEYTQSLPDGAMVFLPKSQIVSASGTDRRTCFSYDDAGRLISSTSPRAGLTSCP